MRKIFSTILALVLLFGAATASAQTVTRVPNGGTGTTSIPTGRLIFGGNTTTVSTSPALFWNISSSRLGVGTGTPLNTLHVLGASTLPAAELGSMVLTTTSSAARLAFGIDTSSTMYSWIQSVLNGTAARGLALNPIGGNVGVGTSTPGQLLSVAGSMLFTGALMPSGTAGTAFQYLRSNGSGVAPTWSDATSLLTAGTNIVVTGTSTISVTSSPSFSGNLTVSGTSTFPGLFLGTDGRVGIGTTTPTQALVLATSSPYITYYDTAQTSANGLWNIQNNSGALKFFRGVLGVTASEYVRLSASSTFQSLGIQPLSGGVFSGTNLTLFGPSGHSYVNNGYRFGINTTTPLGLLSLNASSTNQDLLAVTTTTGARLLTIDYLGNLTTTGFLGGTGTAPTVSTSTGAGNASISISSTSTDVSGLITLTTVTEVKTGNQPVITLTFATPKSSPLKCSIAPANTAASDTFAAVTFVNAPSSTPATFTIYSNTTGVATAGATYLISYHCLN